MKNLNAEQRKAVMFEEGPLLIIAGAGTGKTTVITHRIAHLIREKKVNPHQILALTFTDKAAFQMQEKVDILVPYGFTDTWIFTFHAFGDRVLRENALELGLNPDFKVLTRPQAAVFFRENLFKLPLHFYRPLGSPTKFIDAILTFFSRLRDEDISLEEYEAYAQALREQSLQNPEDMALKELADRHSELAECYGTYQRLLLQESKIDFASQFYLVLQLFRQRPSILRHYQEQFQYILVDEFQDTNYAQFELIKLLAGSRKNLTVVADDDQSIYKWRGAATSNILNFMKEYPHCEKIALTKNYRSTQPILDCAYQLIQHNNPDRFEVQAGINKHLTGLRKKGEKVRHYHFESLSAEADWVAEQIQLLAKKHKYSYSDFAILVRTNSSADAYMRALNMQGIPWQFSGNQGLYSRPEVRLCIAFLRVMADPSDSLSLFYLATSPVYRMPMVDLTQVMHYAKRRQMDLFNVLRQLETLEGLPALSVDFYSQKNKFIKEIESFLEKSREYSTGRLLYLFLTGTDYLRALTNSKDPADEEKIRNIALFFDSVREFEYVAKEDRVIYFTQYLDLLIDAGEDPASAEASMDTPAVNILTIHKAKGLEFPVVFLVDLVEGKFPCYARKGQIEIPDELIKDILPVGDYHIQEERRLFYVGMTRAENYLFLLSASDYGLKRPKKVSRFVTEAVSEAQETTVLKTSALESIERHAPRPEPFHETIGKVPTDKVLSLSYYQIDDYLTCPLKYKYVHILKVPILAHHTVLYGKALHDAIQFYHLNKIKKIPVSLDQLHQIFDEAFRREGFLSKEHVAMRLKAGQAALQNFYQQQETTGIIPCYVEKEFSFAFENNRIVGRWDRIDLVDGEVRIIDFKSSHVADQKEADKRAKESLQLGLYSLAYEHSFKQLPHFTELHFLETGLIGRAPVTQKGLEKVEKAIKTAAAGIRQARFEAKPSPVACENCAYRQICPYAILPRRT